MRIGGGGSQDVNVLLSDSAQFRNEDFVSVQARAYIAGRRSTANTSEYSYVQLLNPAASGKLVLLDRFNVSTDAAGLVRFGTYDTAFENTPGAWMNVYLGQADGVALLDHLNSGSLLGTGIDSTFLTANVPWRYDFDYPLLLGEGKGILVYSTTQNQDVTATFWGREV